MGRTALSLAGVLGLVLLAGCTQPPQLPYENGVGVADVIRNVKCELAMAVVENAAKHKWLKTWGVAVDLTLDVVETGGGGVGGQIVVPFDVTNSVGLGADLRKTARARNISTINFGVAMSQLSEKDCAVITADANHRTMLRGSLGLTSWIARAADSLAATGITGQTARVGYVIEFGIVAQGALDPNFTIVKIGDFELGGRGGVSANRSDTHSLAIGIAPIPPFVPLPVYVTNLHELQPVVPGTGGKALVQPAPGSYQGGLPEGAMNNLNDIIRSLKQTQYGDD